MSEIVKIRMKNRTIVEIPKSNLGNFKRIFFAQIDHVIESEGEPIIAKPIIEEIKTPVAKPIVEETKVVANDTMTKKELQDLATSKGIEFSPSDKKSDLINKINK